MTTPFNLQDHRPALSAAEQEHQRPEAVAGIALHHTATTGLSVDALIEYQRTVLGQPQPSYHYLVDAAGKTHQLVDDNICVPHATIIDPEDQLELQQGQRWNRQYLAVGLLGDFNTAPPTDAQLEALLQLLPWLLERHQLSPNDVYGARELRGLITQSPGLHIDLVLLRQQLHESTPHPSLRPQDLAAGRCVLLLPDRGAYFYAALGYIWKFQPDVSFAGAAVAGRWPALIAVGPLDDATRAACRLHGTAILAHIDGEPEAVQTVLDGLLAQNIPLPANADPPPAATTLPRLYTVQPGDTLAALADRFYQQPALWSHLHQANRNRLPNPEPLPVGLVLDIPPKP